MPIAGSNHAAPNSYMPFILVILKKKDFVVNNK